MILFNSQRFDLYRYTPTDRGGGLAKAAASGELAGWLAKFWRQGVRPIFKSQPAFPAVSEPSRQVQALSGESFEQWGE